MKWLTSKYCVADKEKKAEDNPKRFNLVPHFPWRTFPLIVIFIALDSHEVQIRCTFCNSAIRLAFVEKNSPLWQCEKGILLFPIALWCQKGCYLLMRQGERERKRTREKRRIFLPRSSFVTFHLLVTCKVTRIVFNLRPSQLPPRILSSPLLSAVVSYFQVQPQDLREERLAWNPPRNSYLELPASQRQFSHADCWHFNVGWLLAFWLDLCNKNKPAISPTKLCAALRPGPLERNQGRFSCLSLFAGNRQASLSETCRYHCQSWHWDRRNEPTLILRKTLIPVRWRAEAQFILRTQKECWRLGLFC